MSAVPTQKSIAEASGVSRATVAAILGGGARAERYNRETRRLVHETAARLNYRPNRAAQTMRRQRSNLIALVHFGVGIEAAEKINKVVSQHIRAAGYDCLSVDMNWHEGSVGRIIEEMIQVRVEGVLISHIQEILEDGHLEALHRAGIPVVAINGDQRNQVPLFSDALCDTFMRLTRHLMDVGHRDILHLGAHVEHPRAGRFLSITQRKAGFKQAIESEGSWRYFPEEDFWKFWEQRLPRANRVSRKVHGFHVAQEMALYARLQRPTYHFCKRLFRAKTLPDAIVCVNDRSAMEAMAAALECRIRIPGDIALTGYDNDHAGAFPAFGFTTAEQNAQEICECAVRAMLQRIANPKSKVKNQAFPSRIILRTSCGRNRDLNPAPEPARKRR